MYVYVYTYQILFIVIHFPILKIRLSLQTLGVTEPKLQQPGLSWRASKFHNMAPTDSTACSNKIISTFPLLKA
jgi:hypothetical protein